MIKEKLDVLIIDDDESALEALKTGLKDEKYEIIVAVSRNRAINIIKSKTIDIVVTDLKLKDGSGLDILNFIQENFPHISVIIITAFGTVESAIEAIRGGAFEYLQKPFRMNDLNRILSRVSENIYLKKENQELKQRLFGESTLPRLIGESLSFKKITEFIKQVAPAQSTVLITGESGTGKELVASAIHNYSVRHSKPFIKINCGAIPENLIEAELFGFERGAFTGAQQQKKGKFELAHEGTLFLDEIGDLQKSLQVKLLRVLESGEFERLGGVQTIKIDVRLVTATNVDLEDAVKKGLFREDLYYRLNVISINIPPLRDRTDDIPVLCQFFIDKYNKINNKQIEIIEPDAIKYMKRFNWKGNVRQLENMIERAVVLSNEKILKLQNFPELAMHVEGSDKDLNFKVGMSIEEMEKQIIKKTLEYHNFDKNKTAMALQVGLTTLYRKIKEYQLDQS